MLDKTAFDKSNIYASDKQDIIAYELLGEGKYFVDVGAGNGMHGSNTIVLEKQYGWKGICIEAHPYHTPTLKAGRNCICLQSVVSDKEGLSNFCYEAVNTPTVALHNLNHSWAGGSGLVSCHHLSPEKISHWYTQLASTVTLDSILKTHNAPKHIDFLDIDVEGAEFKVLKGINWEDTSFGLINIEIINDRVLQFLEQKGYVSWQKAGQDTMFKPC